MAKNKSKIMQARARKKAQRAVDRKRTKTRRDDLLSTAWAALHGCTRAAVKQAPLESAYIGQVIYSQGIGNVLVTRRLPDHRIAFGMFLIDAWCLGVKDAFFRVEPPTHFESTFQKSDEHCFLKEVDPACACKMIYSAMAYARELGFKPHPDYHAAALILDGIDPADCTETFTFGRDGIPHYFAGPNDSASMIQRVAAQLRSHCGPDGFYIDAPLTNGFYDLTPDDD